MVPRPGGVPGATSIEAGSNPVQLSSQQTTRIAFNSSTIGPRQFKIGQSGNALSLFLSEYATATAGIGGPLYYIVPLIRLKFNAPHADRGIDPVASPAGPITNDSVWIPDPDSFEVSPGLSNSVSAVVSGGTGLANNQWAFYASKPQNPFFKLTEIPFSSAWLWVPPFPASGSLVPYSGLGITVQTVVFNGANPGF